MRCNFLQKIILNPDQKDALQEVANIGAAHAATALSKMTNREIQMGIPKVEVIPIEKTVENVMDEEVITGVFLKIEDGIPLNILLLSSIESSISLSNMLMGKNPEETKDYLDEMDQSAMKEVGNVIMCAFFDSLSELLNISLIPGPPNLAYDMPAAVLDYVLIQLGEVANEAVVFSCDVKEEQGSNFKLDLFLLPSPNSVKIMLEKLGMN
jgi:chemotaxis protein CheC